MRDQEFAYGGGLVTERGLRLMSRWGLGVLAVWAGALGTWAVLWPDPYAHGWWLVLELFAVGRTVCAYEGIRLGFSGTYLLIQGGAQDIGFYLIIFPWVVRFHEHVARVRFIGRILGSVTRAAERHQQRLQGFGAVGLFLFVFFPISGTGTLVGSVVGYLLGMRMRLVIPVVIAGHLASIAFLLAFFDWLEPVLHSVNAGFAQYFAWILLVSLVVLGWLYGVVKSRIAQWRGTLPELPRGDREAVAEAGE